MEFGPDCGLSLLHSYVQSVLVSETLDASDLASLGWELKPEGLCQDDRCVPLPKDLDVSGGVLPTEVVGQRLGMPVLHDADANVWAIGPEAQQPLLASNRLPDLTLADFNGNPFNLGQLQGRKTLLVAWASW